MRELLGDVRDEAEIDLYENVREVAWLMVGGALGGLTLRVGSADLALPRAFILILMIFVVGFIMIVGLEFAVALGPAIENWTKPE